MPTEAKDIFEAHSRSLRELLSENGLGLYLPPYQRPYGWSRDKVDKLIDDTLHGLRNLGDMPDSFTFLGTVITIHDINHVTIQPVVKTEVPAKVLTVIDGQQRLSTLLMLVVCLHNQIRQSHWRVFKGKAPDPEDSGLTNLHEETVVLLKAMGSAFYEKQQIGDSPIYPRLIRAFQDQWAKKLKQSQYYSPIAHLVYNYAKLVDSEENIIKKPTDFRPKPRENVGYGEADLVKRFSEMRNTLIRLVRGKPMEEFEELPLVSVLAEKVDLQRALFNHPLDEEFCDWMRKLDESAAESELVRLVMLGAYVLNRIALTVVKGKDEDYAFTIFESLNTTGEPLTAFETFLPRVVMAEGLSDYQESDAHRYMLAVQDHLSRFPVGDRLQSATRELLVTFALAETGTKLSKRLADQRVYMKEAFDRYKDSADERECFLRHLRDTATFVGSSWDPGDEPRHLAGLDAAAMTDTVKLCLGFLHDLNHSVVIAPLVRFYSEALYAGDDRRKKTAEFEEALKAITAFTVFWRATRRSTGNIDSEYREAMAGASLTGMPPLARQRRLSDGTLPAPVVDINALKAELVARLEDVKHGDIPNLATFVARASAIPLYKVSRPLTRFLLLAAYHDSVEDPEHPGLIKHGKVGASPCLTAEGWSDEIHLTIEHVAPQVATSGWDETFYAEKDGVHKLGNLVLAPSGANSSLSSRPWQEKRVLYRALGASSSDEARSLLQQAEANGMSFAQSTEELTELSHYLPHLRALGQRMESWDVAFMEQRAACLLRLAYARLGPWLGLTWSESEDASLVIAAFEDLEGEEELDSEEELGT
ncbi:DUF262 domain-containing protein [Amycolatopsis taiwanensis]|uniref:DUF262 domain-containing protein n=1 Tax=Amycolatopsis taiwanensis TaxID=342230 RepID=A0A9W6VL76_9PSEU|nr:DUF262 domain-containing HNH endonuclease family protein [Amycolatopsis taiwanensis]GLY71349.1 hypothetical protein Atai01_79680 [Amycolatopsis taiwanensis]